MNKVSDVTVSAPGRIDLSGGPTDWCGGNTLALAINLRARVHAHLLSERVVRISIADELVEYETPVYDGKLDLFKAVIELAGVTGVEFTYSTEIPKGSGLGGSAPLTVATVMAINKLFTKNWSPYYMAELAQRAETYKLHTVNGYQDQYSAMFGGLNFMNFEGKACQRGDYSKTVEEEPYATVESLESYAPGFNILVAVPEITRTGSDQTNGSLSDRYLSGEKPITESINKMMILARNAKKFVVDKNLTGLYSIINQDNEILRQFGFVSSANEEIIAAAQDAGAVACKTCGAGRGAVALFAEDQDALATIKAAVEPLSEHVFIVHKDEGARYE